MDDERPKVTPIADDRIWGWAYIDSLGRNIAALAILIGGSVALAIWVSPWFWILVAVIIALTIALVASRSRAR